MSGSVMPDWMFRLRHLFHSIGTASSCDGVVLVCDTCGVVNRTPEQEEGSSRKHKSFEEWKAHHERHGAVYQLPGGTFEYGCSCGSEW